MHSLELSITLEGALTTAGPEPTEWHSSTSCDGGACVQVAYLSESVAVRSSRDGPVLICEYRTWAAFIAAVKRGLFDWEH